MNKEFIKALDNIQKEKGIDKNELIDAIEAAIISAYKKNYGSSQNVEIQIDREDGTIVVNALKTVVENVEDKVLEISLEDAREILPVVELGDIIPFEVVPKDFGRIAAQNAKQVVIQRIKEAEREIVYHEYLERQDELLNGIIKRIERKNVYVDLGKTEGIILPNEQMPHERYEIGDRIKVYVSDVKSISKGAQVHLSRTHPGVVKRLFESEVPEIYEGIVEIKSVAREAGSRTKIAVDASNPDVDPVGACVGQKGIRVQNIIRELNNEKIDIIKWDEDPKKYIINALSPAKVLEVLIDDEKKATVVVDDFQLSLAIGKEGQNVRLAAKLTGWKVDIKSKSEFDKLSQNKDATEELAQQLKDDLLSDTTDAFDLLGDVIINQNIDDSTDQLQEDTEDYEE
jgi:N utilization substance protein A